MSRGLTDKQIQEDKTNSIMNLVAKKAGYYRHNLHRFCYDYLGITKLKWFQKILLWMFQEYDNSLFLACRGIGKTYLCSLFAVCRCILYPGQLVISVSATYKQARNMIKKVTEDFMVNSALLQSEILKWSDGQNDCYIQFKNGSIFRAITATESSRGYRSHIQLRDERRLIPEKVVETIIRPMNAVPRQPKYLTKYPEKVEMLKEIDLSSSWYTMSELYEIAKSYCASMLEGGNSFCVVDIPYQVSIKSGLLMKQQILNEKSQSTFNEISFSMEREGLFWGSSEDALFDYKILDKQRVVVEALHSLDLYQLSNIKMLEKQKDEVRVLSVDIALLASKKHDNDSSSLQIHSAIPTSNHCYMDNIIFIDSQEGLLAEDLGLLIMRYFNQYDCDYISIDGSGVGQPIIDYLMSDRYDPMYGVQYGALNVMNNADLSERCKVKNAPKVIYVIKANSRSNNDMCLSLRAGFQNGYINLLIDDNMAEEHLTKIRGYSKLTETQQAKLKLPYIQTTFLINELINLTHDTSSGLVKVKERTGMRKDRYSSALYGWALIQELNNNLKPKTSSTDLLTKLTSQIRPSSLLKR